MWKKIWQKWTSLKWTGFKTSFKYSFCLFVSGRTKLENTVKIKVFLMSLLRCRSQGH